MILSSTATTTLLDPVISNLTWGDAFGFGKGVDAITGTLMPSAITEADPVQQTVRSSRQISKLIQSEDDINQEISAAVSGKYNVEGVSVQGAAEYVQYLRASRLSLSIVAYYWTEFQGYDELRRAQLTDEAKAVDPKCFRDRYGDYFIMGAKRSSNFVAVYTCEAATTDSMMKFSAQLTAELPDVFSAEGKVSFEKAVTQNNIRLTIKIFMDGYDPAGDKQPAAPSTPDEIIATLDWFKAHEKGVYTRAELMHYNALDGRIPRTVNVPPETFFNLQNFYTTFWNVRVLYNSCPVHYKTLLNGEYDTFNNLLRARKGEFANDPGLLADSHNRAKELANKLRNVFDRFDLFSTVKASLGQEAASGQEIDADGRSSWLYGLKTFAGATGSLKINTDTDHCYEEAHVGWREHTFQLGGQGKLIVGWEVISEWPDRFNGWWRKNSNQVLLKNEANVYVCSLYDRGTNWRLNIYWVPEEDYRFQ